METAMLNEVRDTSGKFAPKSEAPRKVRSVNLTDDAWQWLAAVAEKSGMSRNDYLQALAEGNSPFIEMAQPLMETAESEFYPLMEMAQVEIETEDTNITQQRDSEGCPLMETVKVGSDSLKQELEEAHADYAKVLESSIHVTNKLRQEVRELRSQLETECAERKEIEAEFSELKQNSAPAAELSQNLILDAATILSQLRARRKKSKADLADLEAILEILQS
jgi:DNA repair exonuclease SbcCD ATPase subunit